MKQINNPNGDRVAVITRIPNEIAQLSDFLTKLGYDVEQVDNLPLRKPFMVAGQAHSFFWKPPTEQLSRCFRMLRYMFFWKPPTGEGYDVILVDDKLELFEHGWSYAFLSRVNALLKSKGSVVLPYAANEHAYKHISVQSLEALFGSTGEVINSNYVRFAKTKKIQRPREQELSLLDTYFDDLEKLLESVAYWGDSTDDETTQFVSKLNHQGYQYGGLRTKAPSLCYLLNHFFDKNEKIHMSDIGGAIGSLCFEMLFNGDTQVDTCTVIEISSEYVAIGTALAEEYGQGISERITFVHNDAGTKGGLDKPVNSAEPHQYEETDLVTMLGTLLLIPREERTSIIEKSWEALRPGGLLVIHENIRGMDEKKGGEYHNLRFTRDELDGLLSKYGEIRYFHGAYLREVPSGEVKNQTLYTVVQKKK